MSWQGVGMRVDGGGVLHADIAGDMSHSEERWGGRKDYQGEDDDELNRKEIREPNPASRNRTIKM
jgi:hypothetical protein